MTWVRTFLFFVVLFASSIAHGQMQRWSESYRFYTTSCYCNSVLPLSNGNAIVAKSFTTGGPSFSILTIFEIDENGDTLWTNAISDTIYANYSTYDSNVCTTSDGNYLFGGSIRADGNDRQYYVIKYTTAGDTLWTKKLGGEGVNTTGEVSEPYPGFYFIAGADLGWNGKFNLYLLDSLGNTVWDRNYFDGDPRRCTRGFKTQDGNFLISGWTWNGNWDKRMYLFKTDSSGTVLWEKEYGAPWDDEIGYVTELDNGELILSGAIEPNENVNQTVGYLSKLTSDGDSIWAALYWDYELIFRTAPVVMVDGYVIAGTNKDHINDEVYGIILKADTLGNELWRRAYTTYDGYDHYLQDLQRSSDGGFHLAGQSKDSLTYATSCWILKVDSFGCLVPGCHIFDGIEEQITDLSGHVSVSPNPSNGLVHLSFDPKFQACADGEIELSIISADGRLVHSETLSPAQRSWSLDLTRRARGVYYVHLRNGKAWLAGKKLVLN